MSGWMRGRWRRWWCHWRWNCIASWRGNNQLHLCQVCKAYRPGKKVGSWWQWRLRSLQHTQVAEAKDLSAISQNKPMTSLKDALRLGLEQTQRGSPSTCKERAGGGWSKMSTQEVRASSPSRMWKSFQTISSGNAISLQRDPTRRGLRSNSLGL